MSLSPLALSSIAAVSSWASRAPLRRPDRVSVVLDEVAYTRDVRGRSPLFWILLMLGIGAVGLALDKVFADNTAPYEEPPIAYIGFFVFLLCGLAFVVLCTLALVRFWRGPASMALTPAVTGRSLGVAIVLALLAFAATQFLLYWGEDVDVRDGGGGTLVFLLAVTSAVILLALTVRAFRHRPEQPRAEQKLSDT